MSLFKARQGKIAGASVGGNYQYLAPGEYVAVIQDTKGTENSQTGVESFCITLKIEEVLQSRIRVVPKDTPRDKIFSEAAYFPDGSAALKNYSPSDYDILPVSNSEGAEVSDMLKMTGNPAFDSVMKRIIMGVMDIDDEAASEMLNGAEGAAFLEELESKDDNPWGGIRVHVDCYSYKTKNGISVMRTDYSQLVEASS